MSVPYDFISKKNFFLSVLVLLIFSSTFVLPQHAFSIEPSSQTSNGTGTGTTNNATPDKSSDISTSSNSSSTNTIPANDTSPSTLSNSTNGTVPDSSSSPITDSSHAVTITITSDPVTVNRGSQVTFTAIAADTSSSSTTPTGTVSWSDGNAGGTFNPVSCILSDSSCITTYVSSVGASSTITITASYGGDNAHSVDTTTTNLTVIIPHSTSLAITPDPATVNRGSHITFTVRVADTSRSSTTPTGTVSWSDGNAGGTFNPSSCILSSYSCAVSYAPDPHHSASIIIAANYGGDNTHSTGAATRTLTINVLHDTTTTITPNPVTINQGSQVTLTARVADTSSSSSVPTDTVSWNDNVGGRFNPTSCTLSSGSCNVSYIPPSSYAGSITITASYLGDGTHSVSTGKSTLTVNISHSTALTVTPDYATLNQGSQVTFTAIAADTSSSSTTPTGTVSWSDGNAGGTFNPSSCTLSFGSCVVSYTSSSSYTGSITINASYGGDGAHSGSSDASQLSINVLPDSLFLSADQSYYAFDDVVTLSVNLPSQSLQNIAIGVTDPNGNNIISRTVTTNENGTGFLQFKIPNTYQTGVYQEVATALVGGKSYTNSTEFTVIKSHGISIDSVQITNQQGDSISMLKKSQNGFVKISLSSDEKMPALLTLNLFDSNQNSLGTASIKSTIVPGKSQVALSFFIPSDVQVGSANVFTDAYSDWPIKGGTPLTTESCLAVDIEDPSVLPVSYTPPQPHSCTSILQNVNGIITKTQSVKMTNNQAEVMLGVAVQNDTMTFMSPAQAHLLALAYNNGTARDTKTNSVALISLNLNNSSLTKTPGNVTKIGPAQFTTLVGPDLQNNPMALKILQEIEISKRQVANIIGNETADKLNQQLVEQQRQTAAAQLKKDLTTLEQMGAANTTNAAYARFLATVSDNRTQAVFQGEFNFMKQRINAANAAMQTVIEKGGSWYEAVQVFNKYATISHAQLVSLNNDLNVQYGLADSRIQSCFDTKGQLAIVNDISPCVVNAENNSTGSGGVSIISVQPSDQYGNPVSLFKMGQNGYVKVVVDSGSSSTSLVTINLFDSNLSSLGTVSATYTLNPGRSEVVLPYYVSEQSGTGLANLYANVFTDWPSKGGTSKSNELSYFVGLM